MEKKKTKTSQKLRIPAFDTLRMFLLILVVNLHREHLTSSPQLFPNRFGWYAVPIFIVLSFYLMNKFFSEDPPTYTAFFDRAKRFFVPFLFWSTVGFLVHPELINLNNIFLQAISGGIVNVPLYYLLLMALFTLIFWILTCLPLSWRIGTLFALVFGMFYLQYSGINYGYFSQIHYALRYCYGRIAELLPYAATGILLGLVMARKTKSWILMLATAGIGGLYAATQPYAHPQGIDYSGIRFYFGGVFIFMYFVLVRNFRLPEPIEKKISLLGAYSLGVYVSHYPLLEFILKHVPATREFNTSFPVLFLFAFIVFCYGVIIGLDRLTRGKFSYLFK